VDGGLTSISANFPLLYEYAAVYVDKLLKGANPASLPVEQGTLKPSQPILRRIIVVRLVRRCHARFSSVVWNGSSASISLMGCVF
jgi:hypothetical protein